MERAYEITELYHTNTGLMGHTNLIDTSMHNHQKEDPRKHKQIEYKI